MNLQIFINESSLHGQYTEYNIEDNIKNFLSTLNFINSQELSPKILITKLFFNTAQALKEQHIDSTLQKNFELRQVFLNNIKNISKWENEQIHDSSICYIYGNENYAGKSIAEISERKIQDPKIKDLLINFPNSKFQTKTRIEVCKDNNQVISLNCSFNVDSVQKFFIQHKLINVNQEYNISCKYPPKDYQTVLNDKKQFKETKLKNQGRKVYERIGYNELWVVDNFHYGKDAHIEIFDKNTSNHLGISPHNIVILKNEYKEKGRTL